jgi:phage gp45-like
MWNQVDLRIRSALRGIRLAFRGRLTRVKSDLTIQQVQRACRRAAAGRRTVPALRVYQLPACRHSVYRASIGGQTSHAIIIATENGAYRLQVASGEMAIYSDEGAFVHIKKGRIVEVDCDEYLVKTKKYTVETEDYGVTRQPARPLRRHY